MVITALIMEDSWLVLPRLPMQPTILQLNKETFHPTTAAKRLAAQGGREVLASWHL